MLIASKDDISPNKRDELILRSVITIRAFLFPMPVKKL